MSTKVSVIFALAFVASVFGQSQRTYLYEGMNSGGSYIVVPETYVADLAIHNWNDRTQSVCVTGAWLFYDDANYNYNLDSGMEYIFGNNHCTNFNYLGRRLTSVRFAGSPSDYRSDTLTVYQKTFFQGEEEYTYIDLPNLALANRHASIIVTGVSGWTLYDRVNYAGNSVCVYPPQSSDYRPYFLEDTETINVPHHTIRSIRKGCFSSKVANTTQSRNLPQGGFSKSAPATSQDKIVEFVLPTAKFSKV